MSASKSSKGRPTSPERSETTYRFDIPNSSDTVEVDLNIIPAEQMPESLQRNSNVANVNIGGREFFVVMGKTRVADD